MLPRRTTYSPKIKKKVSFVKKPSIVYIHAKNEKSGSPRNMSVEYCEHSMDLTENIDATVTEKDNVGSNENVDDTNRNKDVSDDMANNEHNMINHNDRQDRIVNDGLDHNIINHNNMQDRITDSNLDHNMINHNDIQNRMVNSNSINYSASINETMMNTINGNNCNGGEFLKLNIECLINDNKDLVDHRYIDTNVKNDGSDIADKTDTDLINTVELKKIVNKKEKKEMNINEVLTLIGVRFLDDLILKQSRRSTISKSRSEIDESLYIYYKYYYEERIAFFLSFLEYIEERMVACGEVLRNKEKEMVEQDFMNIKNAKALKTECRNREKIGWYEIRKTRELRFNSKIADVRDRLLAENKKLKEECERREKEKKRVDDEIAELEDKLKAIETKEIRTSTNDADLHIREKQLQDKIKEQTGLIDSLQRDIDHVRSRNSILQNKLQTEKEEENVLRIRVKEMEENMRTKTVDERECEHMKKRFMLYSTFFKFDVKKIGKDMIDFTFLQFNVHYDLNGSVSVSSMLQNAFLSFYCDVINRQCSARHMDSARTGICLKELVNVLSLVSFYHEEICLIERKHFLTMLVRDRVCLDIKIPSISGNDRDVKAMLDEHLVLYHSVNDEYVRCSTISILDLIT